MTTATTKKTAKSVTILARYEIKSSGSIVYSVRNGEQKVYNVTLNSNGSAGCYNKETSEECKGHKYAHHAGHECHHVVHCQQAEADRQLSREQYVRLFNPCGLEVA